MAVASFSGKRHADLSSRFLRSSGASVGYAGRTNPPLELKGLKATAADLSGTRYQGRVSLDCFHWELRNMNIWRNSRALQKSWKRSGTSIVLRLRQIPWTTTQCVRTVPRPLLVDPNFKCFLLFLFLRLWCATALLKLVCVSRLQMRLPSPACQRRSQRLVWPTSFGSSSQRTSPPAWPWSRVQKILSSSCCASLNSLNDMNFKRSHKGI